MSVALVNNSFYKSFDTTFIENEKNCENINYLFFSFFIKISYNSLTNTLRAFINIFLYIYI